VLVDDGSDDHSLNFFVRSHPWIASDGGQVAPHFGQDRWTGSRFDHVRGGIIIAMDGTCSMTLPNIVIEKIAEAMNIVSGWRKQRIDNFCLRRFSFASRQLGDGKTERRRHPRLCTTFKAYRREILEQVPLYGELHRLFRRWLRGMARRSAEVPIRNVNRERGVSHYGISRTFRVFFDLITIAFLLRYLSRPLHFFGTGGCSASSLAAASPCGLWRRSYCAMRMSSLRTDL